ncbi:PqqD family protein [Nitrospirillum iridis]|uniref:Dephospho-CoA kinase n=1 Tax=Nitrospirillum iridis TaxID=765888 RepID=A0A7X0B3T8_9PROT|nr:PqqD family protein [Nitrospirillum iridis]MBB6253719.1 dephospho-CoA kinase [Nitrospirillum iridis]
MPPITPQSCIQRKPDVLTTDVNGEVVMMNAALGEYYGLNPVASDIWLRLAQPRVVADLVRDLADSYEGDPAVIEADLLALFEGLMAKDMIVVDTPATGTP